MNYAIVKYIIETIVKVALAHKRCINLTVEYKRSGLYVKKNEINNSFLTGNLKGKGPEFFVKILLRNVIQRS
jgi:hypothetical protein